MGKQQQQADGIDLVKLSRDLRDILSDIPVNGPENVHKMDMVLQGLAILHNNLLSEQNKKKEKEQEEREQI